MWAKDSAGHGKPALFGLPLDERGHLETQNRITRELSGESHASSVCPGKSEGYRLLRAKVVLQQERRPHPPKGNCGLLLLRVDHVAGLGAREALRPSAELTPAISPCDGGRTDYVP